MDIFVLVNLDFIFYNLVFYFFLGSGFSSSEIMQKNPARIIKAPVHHMKFVLSPNMTDPRNPEMIKFDAVEITVGTNVLALVEWSPLTKYRQTIALAANIRQMKNPFWTIDVSWKRTVNGVLLNKLHIVFTTLIKENALN